MRYVLIIVIAMLTLLSNMAYANAVDCYAPSPNLSTFGDAYYDLENTSALTNETKNRINSFFGSLAGEWKGNAQAIECSGPDRAPQIKSIDAIINAKARLDSVMGLSVSANKHYVQENIKKSELLALIGNSAVFNVEFADDQHLVFSEKYRRMNTPLKKQNPNATSSNLMTIINKITGNKKAEKTTEENTTEENTAKQIKTTKTPETRRLSRVTETIFNIILENKSLIISRSYYINGVFTGAELWQLVRD
jgi:hypothetical protein